MTGDLGVIEDIEALAREAGDVAMGFFQSGLAVESKGHLDLVTAADREVERLIVDRLRTLFPDDGIVAEEGSAQESRSGRFWVIDPIDGTFNFVRGADQWSVSIGLFDGSRPVLGVVNMPALGKLVRGGVGVAPSLNGQAIKPLGRLDRAKAAIALGLGPVSTSQRGIDLVAFVATQGMAYRYGGCGSVSLLSVALGQVDGYISLGESSWDVMAALAILHELGGESTVDWMSAGLRQKFPLACGTPEFLAIATGFDFDAG